MKKRMKLPLCKAYFSRHAMNDEGQGHQTAQSVSPCIGSRRPSFCSLQNLSYRVKLILIYCITVIVVATTISVTLTVIASRRIEEDKKAHLNLLTEQVLYNFRDAANAASQQLINMVNSKGVASLMYINRNLQAGNPGYYQRTQELVYAVNQMITAHTYYSQIYIRMDSGLSLSNSFTQETFLREASELLSADVYGENTYGRTVWTCSESGEVYIIRDIYNQSPIRHMGKIVACVRQELLASLGSYSDNRISAVVFLDSSGRALTATGEKIDGMAQAAEKAVESGLTQMDIQGSTFIASIQSAEGWTAVGLLPEKALHSVRQTMTRTGLFVALLGVGLGALTVIAATHSMTRQVHLLVKSMDDVSAGNMDLIIPVESRDEIGQMTIHFNRMIRQTRELLQRVVDEETRKSKAEYEMLEYKYRSLQSQINPHFIYNAMETVNALAKIDGNDEICDVVQHISAFFRQNTRNMQKRFISVQQEFESLKQYAYIYHHIHGEMLSTPFLYSPDVADALIPTMILQPVLENALVHGVRPASDQAVVEISSKIEGEEWLLIEVRDNGRGMPAEIVDQILYGQADAPLGSSQSSTGIGMRNVRDRLKLIYGNRASLNIDSKPDEGTLVSIRIPFIYDEQELNTGI